VQTWIPVQPQPLVTKGSGLDKSLPDKQRQTTTVVVPCVAVITAASSLLFLNQHHHHDIISGQSLAGIGQCHAECGVRNDQSNFTFNCFFFSMFVELLIYCLIYFSHYHLSSARPSIRWVRILKLPSIRNDWSRRHASSPSTASPRKYRNNPSSHRRPV
jgi:hypothetical protein